MLGSASQVRTSFVGAGFIENLQSDVNRTLECNPLWEIIDIKYQSVPDPISANGMYHTAMIIYLWKYQ